VITVTFDENEPLGQFIVLKAEQLGKSPNEVALSLIQDWFEQKIRALHRQFMDGQFTQGEIANLLGLNRIDLIHLLDNMGLSATNV
jgi:hypothetical protein